MSVLVVLLVVAVGALGYAYYKHVGFATIAAGVAAEVIKLEAAVTKVESAVKVDIAASIVKLKELL